MAFTRSRSRQSSAIVTYGCARYAPAGYGFEGNTIFGSCGVSRPAVYGRDLGTERPQVCRQLSPMMNGVEQKQPERLSERLLQNGYASHRDGCLFFPPSLIHLGELFSQARRESFVLFDDLRV